MKDLLIRATNISDTLVDLINQQIKIEGQSSADYLSMATWCDVNGYSNSAQFFYNQSDEERGHQLKLVHYLSDMGAVPEVPSVDIPKSSFASLKDIFETMLIMERSVTDSIHNIVSHCRKENDFSTEEFLQWFVKEQREEEFIAREMLGLFELLGEEQIGLAMFEEKVLNVSYSEEE